jgi:serine/threonine-protein kinase
MGKTTLIQQTLNRLRLDNYRTVNLSLHLAERKDFADLDYFLRWVCIWVGQSLGLENCLEQYWNLEFSTSKMNCTNYFEKYLLAQADTPLVLCLDDLDRIFEYEEVAAEFLGLLRAWYEQGRNRPIWKRLRLVLSHSTEVYIPLNIYESPFNVGKSIELSEFCFDQIEILAQSHNINGENLQKLHGLVGGHPHLIDQAFTQFKLQSHISLEQLLADAASEGGIYSGHLQHLWRVIHRHEHLITALRQVINSDQPVQLEPEDARQLYYLGLVTYQSNTVVIRCHLYHQYFCRKLQQ